MVALADRVGLQQGWAGAQWDYSRVGLVHSGIRAGLGWCTVGLQRGWFGAQWDYSGVGLVHSGTTAGLGGAWWDYSGVGLVHSGTTAGLGWCTVGLQRGWAGA